MSECWQVTVPAKSEAAWSRGGLQCQVLVFRRRGRREAFVCVNAVGPTPAADALPFSRFRSDRVTHPAISRLELWTDSGDTIPNSGRVNDGGSGNTILNSGRVNDACLEWRLLSSAPPGWPKAIPYRANPKKRSALRLHRHQRIGRRRILAGNPVAIPRNGPRMVSAPA
jgi:hypothetical protein